MRRLTTIAILLVASGRSAATQDASSVRIPEHPGLEIQVPVRTNSGSDLLLRMLTTSGTRFGLEHVPPSAAPLQASAVQKIKVSGLPLSDALDRIVSLDTRYRWEESGNRIVVRPAGAAPGFLDRRVPGFTMQGSSLPHALESLMRAAIPQRLPGGIATMAASAAANDPALAVATLEPLVSVRLDQPTVLEVLNALAAAHGHLSWVVRYERPEADAEDVSVSLITQHHSITAVSVTEMRTPRSPDGRRIFVPAGDVSAALNAYKRRSGQLIGFERVPSPARVNTSGITVLDLTGLPPIEALQRVIDTDSRYEVREAHGILNVLPRADLGSAWRLDRPIEQFTVSGELLPALVERLAALIAATDISVRRFPVATNDGGILRRLQPLSFTLRNTTAREILNTICTKQGTLSWAVTPQPPDAAGVRVTLDLSTSSGEGYTATFRVPSW